MARSRDEIDEDLTEAYAARRAILKAQSYSMGDRVLTRANLSEVNRIIKDLERELARADRGGGARVRGLSH